MRDFEVGMGSAFTSTVAEGECGGAVGRAVRLRPSGPRDGARSVKRGASTDGLLVPDEYAGVHLYARLFGRFLVHRPDGRAGSIPRAAIAASIAWLVGSGSPVFAQIAPRWEAPTLTTLRYDETWDQLADPAKRTDWISKLKYIPLDDGDGDGDHLTTGLELRARVESYRNDNWSDARTADQTYLLSRFMPFADLHVGRVRAFAQPMVTVVSGGEARPPVDGTGVDLLQGFVDVDFSSREDQLLIIRAGREMVSLGSERFVGTRYGPNTPRSFDGIRGIWKTPVSRVTAFDLRPVDVGPRSFDDRTSRTQRLWGLYGTYLFPAPGSGMDFYYLGYANDVARFANVSGRERRQTFGGRYFGRGEAVHWNVELLYQFGRLAHRRISAYGVAVELGHKFAHLRFTPDFTLRADLASGDRGKGAFGTANALFPNGGYFGRLSPVGPYNLMNVNPALAFDLPGSVKFGVSAQAFWRQRVADGIYNVPGFLLRAPGSSAARYVGSQLEAVVQWRVFEQLGIEASLSDFQPGDFIRQTGSARHIRLLALEANYRF